MPFLLHAATTRVIRPAIDALNSGGNPPTPEWDPASRAGTAQPSVRWKEVPSTRTIDRLSPCWLPAISSPLPVVAKIEEPSYVATLVQTPPPTHPPGTDQHVACTAPVA